MIISSSPQPSSFYSSCTHGHRPYQFTILVLVMLFGWYVSITPYPNAFISQSTSSDSAPPSLPPPRQFRIGPIRGVPTFATTTTQGTATATDATGKTTPTTSALTPPATQNCPVCKCECPKVESHESSPKALVPSSGSSSSHSAHWPALSEQIYSSRPRVVDDSYMQFVRAAYPPVGPEKGSIMDPSYLATPIAYGTHFVPLQEKDGIPDTIIPRPQCQIESDIVQKHIYANQHPSDCKTARLFVRRHMPSWGLFAGLGLSSNYLYLATVLGRTLVDLSPNTYFSCAKGGLQCPFLPVGSCTANDFREDEVCYDPSCWSTARVISIDKFGTTDYLPCSPTEFPKQRCNINGGPKIERSLHEVLPQLRSHGEQFFQGEFTRYLTRPNKELAEYTAQIMHDLQLTDELISVHVRHGDKAGEGIVFPTRAYSVAVKRAIQVTGIKTVFIGSDDKSVYEELPKWVDLPGVTYKWIDPDLAPIVHSAAEAGRKGASNIGMILTAQAIIFTQSHTFIGTRSSNIGQTVYSMQANDCSRQRIAYDMYGDLYYNSWYCRGDIEHAGLEWMCALQKPAHGSTIHQWGGAKTQC